MREGTQLGTVWLSTLVIHRLPVAGCMDLPPYSMLYRASGDLNNRLSDSYCHVSGLIVELIFAAEFKSEKRARNISITFAFNFYTIAL